MELIIKENTDSLIQALAGWITGYVADTLKTKGRFSLCLSGGNTPAKLYELLASPAYRDKIEWERIHFFWGDERHLPLTDEKNNAHMAISTLLSRVPVKKENVHIIDTSIAPADSAKAYDAFLRKFFGHTGHTFDLVLVGLGDNAHTLSLFPGYDVVQENKKWVRSFFLSEQNMFRITLTAPVVNAAAAIAFLITGPDKATAVKQVLEGAYDPGKYPAQVIKPASGKLSWWLDREAAVKLTSVTISKSTN